MKQGYKNRVVNAQRIHLLDSLGILCAKADVLCVGVRLFLCQKTKGFWSVVFMRRAPFKC